MLENEDSHTLWPVQPLWEAGWQLLEIKYITPQKWKKIKMYINW
jgi:hypothetical protein